MTQNELINIITKYILDNNVKKNMSTLELYNQILLEKNIVMDDEYLIYWGYIQCKNFLNAVTYYKPIFIEAVHLK